MGNNSGTFPHWQSTVAGAVTDVTYKAPDEIWQGKYSQEEVDALIQLAQKVAVLEFMEWFTSEGCEFITYWGGADDRKKDYRFASNEKDYTIEEMYEIFIAETKNIDNGK